MKKMIALVLSLVMALSLCTPAWGAATTVSTAAELAMALANDEDVTLANDIVLTGEWTPIGNEDTDDFYTGTLDGQGHTISGLLVTSGDYAALIRAAKGATIKNLTVSGSVTADNAAGVVARVEGDTVIDNVVSNVTVSGSLKAGGISANVCHTDSVATFINCVNNGSVSCSGAGNGGSGGLIGYVNNDGIAEIKNCVNNGTIAGANTNGQHAGVVIGTAAASSVGTIINFTNTGAVTGNFNSDTRNLIQDGVYLAGFCGTRANWTIAVAEVGGTKYETLQEAVAVGGEVKLLSDVALTGTVNVTKSVTIDGNGHKITNAGTTTNSAVLLGDSSWGEDMVDTCSITLKNATFDGWATDHVVRVQGVKATIDNCTFQNCTSANVAFGVVTLNYSEATVQNCTFDNNTCAMVVNVNYSVPSTTVLTKSNTIDNCVFTGNTVSGVSVVYYSQGGGFVCKNSEFTGNTVDTSSHAAVVYGEVMTVTGNTFTGNTVTADGARAGVVVADGGKVNENVFSNNTLSSENADAKYEATVVSKGDGFALDLNANYWGDGSAPAEGVDYVNAKPAEANTITATTYYAAVSADGAPSSLVDPNAPKPPVYYPTYYPTTSDKLVESAKTADPIALYIGVTVLGATGSAWLLRKKED